MVGSISTYTKISHPFFRGQHRANLWIFLIFLCISFKVTKIIKAFFVINRNTLGEFTHIESQAKPHPMTFHCLGLSREWVQAWGAMLHFITGSISASPHPKMGDHPLWQPTNAYSMYSWVFHITWCCHLHSRVEDAECFCEKHPLNTEQ